MMQQAQLHRPGLSTQQPGLSIKPRPVLHHKLSEEFETVRTEGTEEGRVPGLVSAGGYLRTPSSGLRLASNRLKPAGLKGDSSSRAAIFPVSDGQTGWDKIDPL